MTGVESMIWGQLGGVIIFNLLTAWPLWRIYRRVGLPGWWSLVAFVPLVGLVAVLAIPCHAVWPNLPLKKAPTLQPKARRTVSGAGARQGE